MQINESEYHFACSRKDVHLFYHVSWQNDICSFRAMTVGLTVSFKLMCLTFILNKRISIYRARPENNTPKNFANFSRIIKRYDTMFNTLVTHSISCK